MKIMLNDSDIEIIKINSNRYMLTTKKRLKNPNPEIKIKGLKILLELIKKRTRIIPQVTIEKSNYWKLIAKI